MIQRFQTILLLGVALCMGMMFSGLIWIEQVPAESREINFSALSIVIFDTDLAANKQYDEAVVEVRSTWYVGVLAILSVLTALFSIFQFKNRLNQMKLGALNSLFMVGTLAACFFLINQTEEVFPEAVGNTQMAFFFPMAGLLLNMIANRFIRKDEKLVKSVDRIR